MAAVVVVFLTVGTTVAVVANSMGVGIRVIKVVVTAVGFVLLLVLTESISNVKLTKTF